MSTIPKPGPVIPLPAVRGAGVNQDSVEARSRIVAMVLPHAKDALRSTEDVLTISEWILLGPDDEEDES
ncbi:hypothetical protein ACIGH6_14425 [Brachybacterium paraconglomeratum]|uniref:hypothetical protein n=1 Tax=Brachybacterium paraconglomeratum TaxID=173362 RepID=UPI0037C6935C